jgi:hypothetical protein
MCLKYSLILVSLLLHNLTLANKSDRINVGITFTKASQNKELQDKLELCVSSLLRYAQFDNNFYIIAWLASKSAFCF